jgi:hypothetical protein
MTALGRAITWKRRFIREVLDYFAGKPALSDYEKQTKEELEKELDILKGADKQKAYKVVLANIRRWLKAAQGNLDTATSAHDVVSWRRIVRERQKLLDDLKEEGPPP